MRASLSSPGWRGAGRDALVSRRSQVGAYRVEDRQRRPRQLGSFGRGQCTVTSVNPSSASVPRKSCQAPDDSWAQPSSRPTSAMRRSVPGSRSTAAQERSSSADWDATAVNHACGDSAGAVGPNVTHVSPYAAATRRAFGPAAAMVNGTRGRCTQPGRVRESMAV